MISDFDGMVTFESQEQQDDSWLGRVMFLYSRCSSASRTIPGPGPQMLNLEMTLLDSRLSFECRRISSVLDFVVRLARLKIAQRAKNCTRASAFLTWDF